MAESQDMDRVVVETHQPPTEQRTRVRKLAGRAAWLPMLFLAAYVWASAPTPQPLLEASQNSWGNAPYSEDIVHFASWCTSGGPVPHRCEQDGVWMTGEDAVRILRETHTPASAVVRSGRTATGFLYLKRLTRSTLRSTSVQFVEIWTHAGAVAPAAIAALLAQGGLLGIWAMARRREPQYRLEVSAHGVHAGGRQIPRDQLTGCEAVGQTIRLSMVRHQELRTPALELSLDQVAALAESIQEIIPSSEERREQARARMQMLRESQGLAKRAKQPQ